MAPYGDQGRCEWGEDEQGEDDPGEGEGLAQPFSTQSLCLRVAIRNLEERDTAAGSPLMSGFFSVTLANTGRTHAQISVTHGM